MLKAVETVTIINRTTEKGLDTYHCHILHGVSWYAQNKYTPDTGGLKASKLYKIRIPASLLTGYLDPDQYTGAAEKAALWTLAPGDKILLGEKESVTGAEFAALARASTACTVLDVHKNLYGMNPHFYVEGG